MNNNIIKITLFIDQNYEIYSFFFIYLILFCLLNKELFPTKFNKLFLISTLNCLTANHELSHAWNFLMFSSAGANF